MSEIRVDTISEKTSANGVAVDGLTIKDGGISATTGAIVFNEASADLDFRVESNDNTHMLFVDGGNNRVGVGTTPDLGVGLHIRTADSGMGSVNANADELIIEGSGASGLSILSGASSKSNIFFGDSGSNVIGNISYNHSDNALEFATNGANQWFIDSSGHLLPAATDHGIYLGVSSATASNLLDDYEEGTWTIILEDDNDRAFTLSPNTGTYIKIGGQVTITGHVVASAINSASGNVRVSGLPFNILGNPRNYGAMTIGYAAGLAITAGTSIAGVGIINTANVNLVNFDISAGTTNLVASKITADGQFIFTMTYTVV